MNARTFALVASVGLIGLGLAMTVAQLGAEPRTAPAVAVAVAAVPISPYTIVSDEMVRTETIDRESAGASGVYPADAVVGLMSVSAVAPGEPLTGANAKPVEEVRYVRDLGLEIVSLQAGVDRMVGGKVRPGHIVNLYGTGQEESGEPVSVLIEPRIWVVGVSSSGQSLNDPLARPDLDTGELEYVGGDRSRPGTLITVAVRPEQAVHIIDAIGARRLVAYVTLAASGLPAALATPVTSAASPPAPAVVTPPWSVPTPFPTVGDGGYGPMTDDR